ncbi:MAG: LysE family translocator, partial [Marinobacter sp.]
LQQSFWIGLTFLLVSVPCVGSWMLGGAGLRKLLRKPLYRRMFNWSMGALLALSVIPMLSVETAKLV